MKRHRDGEYTDAKQRNRISRMFSAIQRLIMRILFRQ